MSQESIRPFPDRLGPFPDHLRPFPDHRLTISRWFPDHFLAILWHHDSDPPEGFFRPWNHFLDTPGPFLRLPGTIFKPIFGTSFTCVLVYQTRKFCVCCPRTDAGRTDRRIRDNQLGSSSVLAIQNFAIGTLC